MATKRLPFELMWYLRKMESKAKIGGMIIEEVKKQSSLEFVRISWLNKISSEYRISDSNVAKYLSEYIHRESLDTLKKEIVFDEETKTNIIEAVYLLESVKEKMKYNDGILKLIIHYYCKEWNI